MEVVKVEPTEMELRVAAALEAVMRENFGKHINTWADVMPPILARAAIRAMREPTKDMLDAGTRAPRSDYDWLPDAISRYWVAMIDAALSKDLQGPTE